jgi:hypothetical protein
MLTALRLARAFTFYVKYIISHVMTQNEVERRMRGYVKLYDALTGGSWRSGKTGC